MTLGLDWTINPPVTTVSEDSLELSVVFGPTTAGLESAEPTPPTLAVGLVGELTTEQRSALSGVFRRLTAPSHAGRVGFVGRDKTLLDADRALKAPNVNLAEAIQFGSGALMRAGGGSPPRMILVVATEVDEPIQDLLAAATTLTERQVGLDIISTNERADHGLLTRLANHAGGEFFAAKDAAAAAEALVERVESLRATTAYNTRIDLEFSHTARPRALFRLQPTRLFLGNIRLNGEDRRLVLDPGPLRHGQAPRYLLTVEVNRALAGRFRLMQATVHHGESKKWTGAIVHECREPLGLQRSIDASVADQLQRALPTAWIEDAARAFAEGDARHVSGALDQLTRHLVCLGHPAVSQVAEMRVAYLRTGAFRRPQINFLRSLAAVL